MPKGFKGFQKGNKEGKGREKGSKNKATLLKEERRAIFDAEVSQTYIETIKKARPEYILDQFLGKAPDKIEHMGDIKIELSPAMKEYAEQILKKQKGESD